MSRKIKIINGIHHSRGLGAHSSKIMWFINDEWRLSPTTESEFEKATLTPEDLKKAGKKKAESKETAKRKQESKNKTKLTRTEQRVINYFEISKKARTLGQVVIALGTSRSYTGKILTKLQREGVLMIAGKVSDKAVTKSENLWIFKRVFK